MNNDNRQISGTDLSRQTLAKMQDPVYRQNVYTLLAQKPEGIRALLTRLQTSEDTEDFRSILTALRRQGVVALRYAEVQAFLKEALQDPQRTALHEEVVRTIGAGGASTAQNSGMRDALIAATDPHTAQEGTRIRSVAALACIREDLQVQRRLAEIIVMDPAPGVRVEAEAAFSELDWGAALVPVLKLAGVLYQAQAKRPRLLRPGAFFRHQAALLAEKLQGRETTQELVRALSALHFGSSALHFGSAVAFAGHLDNLPDGSADGFKWWFESPDKTEGANDPTLMISAPKATPDDDPISHRIIKIENLAWKDQAAGSFVGYLFLSPWKNEFVGEMEWPGDLPAKIEWRFTLVADAEIEEDSLALLCDTQKSKTEQYRAFLRERVRQGSSVARAALEEIGTHV